MLNTVVKSCSIFTVKMLSKLWDWKYCRFNCDSLSLFEGLFFFLCYFQMIHAIDELSFQKGGVVFEWYVLLVSVFVIVGIQW